MRQLNLKRRLTAEAGFVLPTAIILLLIITLLAGASIAVAVSSSKSTTRDSGTKAALAAAEAGLQLAAYRLNTVKPKEENCINSAGTVETSPTLPAATPIYCEGPSKVSLGNDATFRYWTSKVLPSGGKCAGLAISATVGFAQRCITAEGKINEGKGNEVGQRLQERIESAIGEELFPVRGILGLKEVSLSGKVEGASLIASNEKIKSEGGPNEFAQGYEICLGGKFEYTGKVKIAEAKDNEKNPPYEKTRTSGCPITPKIPSEYQHTTLIDNNDSRITNKEDLLVENTSKAIEFSGSPTYELKLKSSGELTLKGSKYYFCNVELTRSSKLIIALGGKVEIYIDSHAENSNCPETSGKFIVEGNALIQNPNGADSLLINVAGKGPVTVANSGSLAASIFAPKATVTVEGNGKLTGPVVGEYVHLKNSGDIFNSTEPPLITQSTTGGAYERKTWDQCTSSAAKPEEGC
ncbi:MAG: DUF7305 domain-containing protein [Solirubrobacteraceae bacterium]